MANVRFRTEEKDKNRAVSSPLAEAAEEVRVSVPVLSRKEKIQPGRILNILPFFLIIAVAMGWMLYTHRRQAEMQKVLSDQYKADVMWHRRASAAYEQMKPSMALFQKIDPRKPQDWTKIDAAKARFLKLEAVFSSPPAMASPSAYRIETEGQLLISGYESRLHDAELPFLAKSDLSARREIRQSVIEDLFESMRGSSHLPIKQRDRLWNAAHLKAESMVAKMSDDEVVAKFLGPGRMHWRSSDALERALAQPVEVPRGLDLESPWKLR